MSASRRELLLAAALLAGGCTTARAGTGARLRIAGDRVWLPVTINGRATEGLLDSAAEASVLDTRFARLLGLDRGVPATARGSGAAIAEARLVGGVTLAAAGLVLRPEAVAVIDLADIARRLTRRPIDVIVGRELFDAARLALDFEAATLTVVAPSGEPRGVRLPLTTRRGVETVPVTIEGRAAQADFDLGNGGRMLLGARFAAALLADGRATGTIGGGGIGGEGPQRTLTVREVVVAGRRFTQVPAGVDASPTAADANIGFRLLRRFTVVTDFAARAVWLA